MRKIFAVAMLCAAPTALPAHVQDECQGELEAANAAFQAAMPILMRVPEFITDKAADGPDALSNLTSEEAFEFVQIVLSGLRVDRALKDANTAFLLCVADMRP